MQWPLETEKSKETDSCLEPLEVMQSCRQLEFGPVRPISDI